MEKIFEQIAAERAKQDKKWGEQNHTDLLWNAILGEEIGEVARSILEKGRVDEEELTQSAAVIVAWLQCRVRNA